MHKYLKAWIEHCHELQSQGPRKKTWQGLVIKIVYTSSRNFLLSVREGAQESRCRRMLRGQKAWCFQGCLWGQSPSSAIFSLVDLHYQAHLMYLWINLLSCPDKIPQTRCLNPQRFIFSQFWSLESKIKVLAGLVLSRSLLGSRGCILAVSPCTLCSECMLLVSVWQNVLSV